jgi:hypothetical protein
MNLVIHGGELMLTMPAKTLSSSWPFSFDATILNARARAAVLCRGEGLSW